MFPCQHMHRNGSAVLQCLLPESTLLCSLGSLTLNLNFAHGTARTCYRHKWKEMAGNGCLFPLNQYISAGWARLSWELTLYCPLAGHLELLLEYLHRGTNVWCHRAGGSWSCQSVLSWPQIRPPPSMPAPGTQDEGYQLILMSLVHSPSSILGQAVTPPPRVHPSSGTLRCHCCAQWGSPAGGNQPKGKQTTTNSCRLPGRRTGAGWACWVSSINSTPSDHRGQGVDHRSLPFCWLGCLSPALQGHESQHQWVVSSAKWYKGGSKGLTNAWLLRENLGKANDLLLLESHTYRGFGKSRFKILPPDWGQQEVQPPWSSLKSFSSPNAPPAQLLPFGLCPRQLEKLPFLEAGNQPPSIINQHCQWTP